MDLPEKQGAIALIPVAAILVASMKFNCLDDTLDMDFKGPSTLSCDATYNKGDEMGYFQHGSTIVMLFSDDYNFQPTLKEGSIIRVGEAIMFREHQTLKNKVSE